MQSVLTVEHLDVTLDGRPLVENVSFELTQGDILAVIGPNGAGKTVLLKALLGTLPSSGRIAWRPGVRIGYVPQRVEADRNLPLTAHDLLDAKLRILKRPLGEAHAIAHLVGITDDTLFRPLGQLSGGQLQKSLIVFALLGAPHIILLDEPTASLDEPTEEHIYALVRRLQHQLGLTVVIVSHDLSIVYRDANKVLCLNRQGICVGPPRDVLTPAALQRLYGSPHQFYRHVHPP